MTTTLTTTWLALMRASTLRATGRECDYARAEGDVDRFDPIGLLALAAGDRPEHDMLHSGWCFGTGHDGAWLSRHYAESYAREAGFPPEQLPRLCEMNDTDVPWASMAAWVETLVEGNTRG